MSLPARLIGTTVTLAIGAAWYVFTGITVATLWDIFGPPLEDWFLLIPTTVIFTLVMWPHRPTIVERHAPAPMGHAQARVRAYQGRPWPREED